MLSRAKLTFLSSLCCLFTMPVCAVANNQYNNNQYANWYQIELIVFALKNPAPSDEIWPLSPLSYPANMLTIAPSDTSKLAPNNLAELQELREGERLFSIQENAVAVIEKPSEFLFKSRVNNNRKPNEASEAGLDPLAESPANELVTDGLKTEIESLFEENAVPAFTALDTKSRHLNRYARSIRRSSLYTLLVHQAWLQPVVSETKAQPILIQAGRHYDDTFEIDGTIKISRSRFLHVNTDLWYTEFSALYQQAATPITLDLPPGVADQYPKLIQWEAARGQYIPIHSHPLVHSRRVRRSTLHYIDHPRFGILIQIEAYSGPESAQ